MKIAFIESWCRLAHNMRALGVRTGFRYWKLQNRAIRQPDDVLQWVEAWRNGATLAEMQDKHTEASLLRQFADATAARLAAYESAKGNGKQ